MSALDKKMKGIVKIVLLITFWAFVTALLSELYFDSPRPILKAVLVGVAAGLGAFVVLLFKYENKI